VKPIDPAIPGDYDYGDGTIRQNDYKVWKMNFGESTPGGAGAIPTAAVSELQSALLLLMGALAICASTARLRQHFINACDMSKIHRLDMAGRWCFGQLL
jgi:hypothetical protein